MFTWKMILVIVIGVCLLLFWCWDFLKNDSHYAVLFDKGGPYLYNFRTGKFLHGLALIKVKGFCKLKIYNSYSKRVLKEIETQKEKSSKTIILFESEKYITLEIDGGSDFLVEIINFMPKC